MVLCVSSMQIKDNIFEKVSRYPFPNRDVILFSFGINSNITYLTKHINSDILNMQWPKITIYFSYFLKSFCNVLKLTLWPVFKHPDVL